MSAVSVIESHVVSAPVSDQERLGKMRAIAAKQPARAKELAWDLLRETQAGSEQYRLPGLFAQGTAPESPDGDCEGIVMNLYGATWLRTVDVMVRVGQLLGGIGWAGKTFDPKTGTGYNRLTPGTLIPSLLVMPRYRMRKVNGELVGFDFHHRIDASPVSPHPQVRSITYDAPEFKNPLMMPRVRDEIVEIVPDVFLGRALIREDHGWRVIGYFGLRHPVQRSK